MRDNSSVSKTGMRACVAILPVFFSALLAIMTLVPDRVPPAPIDVIGSATPPEFAARNVSNIVGRGDFVTRDADGEAYAQVRFAAPLTLAKVVHAYASEVFPRYRVRRAKLQWSQDGKSWSDGIIAGESNGVIVFDLSAAGSSAWWRFVVVESGQAPEVVIGNLTFREHATSLARIPVDVAWFTLIPALLFLFFMLRGELTHGRFFLALAIPLGLLIVAYAFWYVPLHLIITYDSQAYGQALVTGTYSTIPNTGYATFLILVAKSIGLQALPNLQLGLQLAFFFLGTWIIASSHGWRWLGPALIPLAMYGWTIPNAGTAMTEALFTAGLTLFAAGLAASARQPSHLNTTSAALGLALAVLVKSVGVVLVAPAILLMRYIPRREWTRVLTVLITPAATIYLLMAFYGYQQAGRFIPEHYGGLALVGHVGWMLNGDFPKHPEAVQAMRAAAEPVLARRPPDLTRIRSISDLDRYVDYTTQEYNPLMRAVTGVTASAIPDRIEQNGYCMQLAVSSITARPLDYLGHVMAHYYGLWRDIGFLPDMFSMSVYQREAWVTHYDMIKSLERYFARFLPPSPEVFGHQALVQAQLSVPTVLRHVLPTAHGRLTTLFAVIGCIAFGLCFLYLLPARISGLYRSEIMLALCVNAYFLGTAMAQVSTQRYAGVAFPAIMLFAGSLIGTTLAALVALTFRARRSAVATPETRS